MEMGDTKKKEDDSCRIKVHIRLNQSSGKQGEAYKIFADGTQLQIPNNEGRLELDRWYRFDHIYSAIASNKEVYKLSTYDLVEHALKGLNTSIFAYGQTGSGKTRTLMSKDGVTAHMVSHLFNRIWKSVEQDYKISCSYFQIYNEHIYDLLNPQNDLECIVREDASRDVYVENMTRVVCETPMDVYELINIGSKSLVLAETKMNRLSCRSHTVCQLSIEKRKKNLITKNRSMQETDSISDILLNEVKEEDKTQIDFATVPFNKVDLRKRHSIAVTKVNENKKSPHLSTSKLPATGPARQRSRANSMKLSDRRNHIRNDSTNSDLQSTPEHRGSLSLPSSQKRNRKKSSNSLPDNKPKEEKITMADSIGVTNLKRLSDLYHSNIVNSDQKNERIGLDREIDSTFSDDGNDSFIDYDASKFLELDNGVEGDNSWILDETESNGFSDNDEKVLRSKISIVDLAGSERLSKSNVDGERLKEAQNINLSLLELGNVISALASGKKKHVPYRNSVLTRLLQDSLGGNCKTKFLLCISTKNVDTNETKCTLEFGQKLTKVFTNPILNFDVDYKIKYEKLMLQMKDNEKTHELVQEQSNTRLVECDKKKQEAEESTCNQQLLVNSMHIKLDNADKKYKESIGKIDTLQQTLVDKESILGVKDEELINLKMEFATFLEKLEEANSSAKICKPETVTCDASTNTSLVDLSLTDIIDGSIDFNVDVINDATSNVSDTMTTTLHLENSQSGTNDISDISKEQFINTIALTSKVVVETIDAATNTTDDYLKTTYSVNNVDTYDVATNTANIDNFNNDPFKETSHATTNTPGISISNPIVVTFIQSDKTNVAPVTASTTNIFVETLDATTNTSATSVANIASNENSFTSFGISSNGNVKASNNNILNCTVIDENCLNDPKTQSHECLFLRYGNIDRIRSAILVELLTLQNLCNRPKITSDEPLTTNEILGSEQDGITTTNEDAEPINDGVYSIISEIFCILPMLSENLRSSSVNNTRLSAEQLNEGVCGTDVTISNRTSTTAPVTLKHTPVKDQLVFVEDYFRIRKNSIKKEMLHITNEFINVKYMHVDIDSISEQNIIEGLIEQLSDEHSLLSNNAENLFKLLNIVLCDHTVTACLLALTKKRHHDIEIELKSNTILDEEYYNDAANNNRSKLSYDLAMDSAPKYNTIQEPHLIGDRNDKAKNKDENDGKKGKTLLGRFLCMPKKSAKVKKTSKKTKENV